MKISLYEKHKKVVYQINNIFMNLSSHILVCLMTLKLPKTGVGGIQFINKKSYSLNLDNPTNHHKIKVSLLYFLIFF